MPGVAGRSVEPPCSVLALKGAVLKVLLSQPGGVAVWDLERLFCQHHGWPLELRQHGYHSLQHLLGDMADLVVLAEEENELQVRCQHPTCHLTGTPMKTPQVQVDKWAGPDPPQAGPRAWSSCRNLSTSHPCKPQAKPHRKHRTRGKASIPPNRTISLSHLPQSHLPVASHQQQLPLLSSSNQPLSLELFQATPPVPPVPVPTLAPGPSQLPCPQHPAKPQRDPPAASQAYSATYLISFPLDGATSVKDKLQAMPSVVEMGSISYIAMGGMYEALLAALDPGV
ncbi:uncharacterized protein LOC102384293 [Alligator sinensis]|uniref:Uncharacterized protein LOC102384293 n=1 Tax=Alligator sinensis TaxID=38654 RepID=A0A1U7RVY5_ALLSI|nr:uncharacterized protein LOC102384293 [Alligator sinensis]